MSANADVALAFGEAPDGRMVSIADVPSGRACGMVCPGCRAPLWAKKGAINAHHFAHAADGSCSVAYETMVHKLAKQIIADEGHMLLPPLEARVGDLCREVRPATWFVFDRVDQEVWQDGIRPDIVGHKGARSLAVEVLVTHSCEPGKIALMRERQAAMVEIDLSRLARDATLPALTLAVTRDAPRRWLFNPKLDVARNEMLREEAVRRAEVKAFAARMAAERDVQIAKEQVEQERVAELTRRRETEARAVRAAENLRTWQAQEERNAEAQRGKLAEAALRNEQRAAKLAQIKAELLQYATANLGADAARAFMALRIWDGTSPDSMISPNEAEAVWDRLHRRVEIKAAAERRNLTIQDKLSRDAIVHFRSEDRARLWLKARHPKLNMLPPLDACLEPDGVRRCMALLK